MLDLLFAARRPPGGARGGRRQSGPVAERAGDDTAPALAALAALLHRHGGPDELPVLMRGRAAARVATIDLGGRPSGAALLGRVRAALERALPVRDPAPAIAIGEAGDRRDDLLLALDADGARFDCAAELLDGPELERLAAHYRRMRDGMAAHPDRPFDELPLLDVEERAQLAAWNDTARDYPRDRCAHQLFEEQAARTPDAEAVVCGDRRLTYRALDERANQLAHHLQALGVGPEVLVGVAIDRSIDLVVALLGIWKAGGAYVPLDPSYPKERLAFITDDARMSLVLTQSSIADRLPDGGSARLVELDGLEAELGRRPTHRPAMAATANHLSHIIYTSGSTGRPKGVAIEHHSVVNLCVWAREVFTPAERAGVLFATSICFDLSVFELFATLSWGGRVVVVDNVLGLAELPAEAGVTLVNTVPSAMATLLKTTGLPATVETVNLAGEPLGAALVAAVLAGGTVRRVYDLYGPSETTTYSTFTARRADAPATIGRPLANTQVHLLDAHRQQVPIGAIGEIYIGGDGVARGYLGRPELTAEKFIANPFGSGRLYKTGDLARWREGGTLEYLGRSDFQVKIRGYRIELGEIEAALARHPSVREVVVVAREDGAEGKRLVGYIVAPGAPPTARALREHLAARLPDYMIPSAFVALPSLPLTPNGKTDRKALPPPSVDAERGGYVAPVGALEEALAAIWGRLLGVESVGRDDNFFDLGGHSLLATQVISRVRAELGAELPLRAIFEAPTLAAFAARVEEARRGEAVSAPLRRLTGEGAPPLSFAQQRLWLIEQLEPGLATYNLPFAIRLRGPLDVAALARSVTELSRRHELLRTRFRQSQGVPHAEILPPPREVPLPIDDLRAAVDREARRAAIGRAEAERPFALADEVPVRWRLLRLGDEESELLLTMHHLAADGWSMGVLQEELEALYPAFARGAPSPLPEPPIQYADYAAWQRETLVGEELDRQRRYWRAQLAGAEARLALPTDRARPRQPSHRGARVPVRLAAPLVGALEALARAEGCTLFMALLGAVQTLLHRYSGNVAPSVGTPIANRTRLETERVVGFFVNTLVMRTDLSGAPSFRALLGRVRAVTLGAYAHQDLPFEKLVEELNPDRAVGEPALFQVLLALQNAPRPGPARDGLRFDLEERSTGAAMFDLQLSLETRDGAIDGYLEYASDLFDGATAARMVAHLRTLLEGIVAAPDRSIAELPILPVEERAQLAAWNDTARDYPRDRCAHQLFEEQAARTPDAEAVVCGDRRLTYRALDERANQLAHHLQALGVGPEVLVGVAIDRSIDLVVALLGIWKAGGAYVPLDPSYPKERLAFITDDARMSLVLTQSSIADRLPDGGSARLVELDGLEAELGRRPTHRPAMAATANHLSHIIYTSGSTGRPKGVAIEHHSVVSLCVWAREVFTPAERAGVLFATSICFDLSVFELFATLSWGGRVVVVDNVLGLAELPAEAGVTLVNTVPSAMATLLKTTGLPATVETVNLAGEPLGAALVAAVLAGGTVRRVYDLYGPSETTTYSTFTARRADAPATIGRPLANTQVHLLDAHRQQVPIGAIGEIYIGGDGVARGYLGRPELTAEKFIANPFGPGRLYKTGDLARWREGGTLEYLGRSDFQVKIRGYRIELGEIEAALARHPSVREVVVVAREGAVAPRLVAYLVTSTEIATPALTAHLRATLPDYMVPSEMVFLPSLPLSPNGKVDRKALPEPGTSRDDAAGPYAAPRGATEELLARIFGEALGRARVGRDDNFFDIGGHSLLAARVIALAGEALGVAIPLRAIFDHPTVAELAEQIGGAPASPGGDDLGGPSPSEATGALSFGEERGLRFHALDPGCPFDHPNVGLRLRGAIDRAALARAFERLIARHEILRASYRAAPDGSAARALAAEVAGPLTVEDLRGLAAGDREVEAARRGAAFLARPFDLGRAPLLRALLLVLDEREHLLLLVGHHVASDGFSLGLMLRELDAHLAAAPLAPLPFQYPDFASWQRRFAASDGGRAQIAYWRRVLDGATPLRLPADRPREPVDARWRERPRGAFPAGEVASSLPAALIDPLRELARRERSSLPMVAMAGFAELLAARSGQRDVCFSVAQANRDRAGTEQLVGCFNQPALVRLAMERRPFLATLEEVREKNLELAQHRDVALWEVVEAPADLFRVSFNYQKWELPSLGGLEVAPWSLSPPSWTRFDLVFHFFETATRLDLLALYNRELFAGDSVRGLLASYQRHLEAAAAG